jgi:all-trans-retinol dehydrogenase (NAD+)
MAHKFSEQGCKVVLWDIAQAGLDKVSEELKGKGGQVWTFAGSVADRTKVYELAEKVRQQVGKVDILVNNAGVVSGKSFLETSDEAAQRTMDVNTTAHFWTAKAFLPEMIKENKGHLVTIASAAGTTGVRGLADYCASKFGAFGFNESLRIELKRIGATGVRTTCVCPYYINTGMFDGVTTRLPFLLPILDENDVANKIIGAIQTNQETLYLPWTIRLNYLLRFLLPTYAFDFLSGILGVHDTMNDFKGRQGIATSASGH